jgi:hypothetical protein
MGATTSTTYKSTQRNPTRNTRTTLTFNETNQTFMFTQEMDKALAEEQTLKTSLQLTGTIERICTDIEVDGRIVKGNPQFKLITTKGKFETRWGDKFYQVKRGQLQLTVPKQATTPSALFLNSPLKKNNASGLDDDEDSTDLYYSLDKLEESHHQQHPWMVSQHHRRNNIATTSTPNSTPTNRDEQRIHSNTNSSSSLDPKNVHLGGGRRRAGSSPGCLDENGMTHFLDTYCKFKPEITVLKNGTHMKELLNCRSIETMNTLLKVDLDEWLASFTPDALDMTVTFLSEAVHLKYYKPKFEYLWAQLQDESPILMSLCSVSYDDQQQQLYFSL